MLRAPGGVLWYCEHRLSGRERNTSMVTLDRTRIHGVNPVYCCAREDQPKRYAFAPRLEARQ